MNSTMFLRQKVALKSDQQYNNNIIFPFQCQESKRTHKQYLNKPKFLFRSGHFLSGCLQ